MRKTYESTKIIKKAIRATILLIICFVASIIINYKDIGTFRFGHRKLPIYSVSTEEKKVALTFDVSLGNDNIAKILDILDEYNVKATFFLVGRWIDDNKEMTKEIYKRGHEIGNHSDKHPEMTRISKDKLLQDIMRCESKIISITGQGTKLFRAPSGAYNDMVIETAEQAGFYCIQWDVDSIDWKEQGADIEYKRVISKVKTGSIILYHNTAKYTPETLPKVLKKLKKDGYSFVKVSDLIYKDNFYIDSLGRQIPK